MEGVVDVHVRHDFVAGFEQVVGHFFGGNLGHAKSGFGIDEAGIDGHAGDVYDAGVLGNRDGVGGADGCDLSVFEDDDAVFDGAVGDGEKSAATEGDGGLLDGEREAKKKNAAMQRSKEVRK